MRRLLATLIVAAALLPLGSAAQSPLTGDVPAGGGVGLATWAGGPVEQLQQAAAAQGCALTSVWVAVGGQFVGWVPNAPAFVNQPFTSALGPSLPPGTGVVLVCQAGAPTVPPIPPPAPVPPPTAGVPIMDVLLTTGDVDGGATVFDEFCYTEFGDVAAWRFLAPTSETIAYRGADLWYVRSDVYAFGIAALARAEIEATRASLPAWYDAEFLEELMAELFGAIDEDLAELFALGSFTVTHQDLPHMGDGGIHVIVEWDFAGLAEFDPDLEEGGIALEFAIVRVDRAILTVQAVQELDGFQPVVLDLMERMVAKAQVALPGDLDTRACVAF